MALQSLVVTVCNSVEEAPDYKGSEFSTANLDKAIVVRNGTVAGNDTVDLQFSDAQGKKYVAMITAACLKTLTAITNMEKK